MTIEIARSWIATSRSEIIEDIERLGLEQAIEYNVEMAQGHTDTTWAAVTEEAMAEAMRELL